ncbi:MAG: carbonic anhydrase [Brevundimonas sp.]|uniref:carbonic anhydrase n=1 Tax=Brevundimonas sp. TaxID=1871086 RepID=UPI00391BE2AA
MDEILNGYRRFRERTWPEQKARFEALAARGQTPSTLVVACSDSRADPAMIFDTAPGELFVVRNVANIVPPYEPDGQRHGVSAALEFGVRVLKVKRIVVMGHAHCGGVASVVSGAPELCRDFVEPWMAQAAPAVRHALEGCADNEVERCAEEAVVRLSLANLRTFPWIAEREAKGDLEIIGLHFGIREGTLSRLGADQTFRPVD